MKLRISVGIFTAIIALWFCQIAIAAELKRVNGETDWMTVDQNSKKITFSATVTKDASKSAVSDWGQRGQAWIGCKGGSQVKFFIFTTDIPRPEIDSAIQDMGVTFSNQIEKKNWKSHRNLKKTSSPKDFLNGDPLMVLLKFEKNGKTVQVPLENLIDEKIKIEDSEIFRPHTPHYVYHGTGETIKYPSGCIVCPSDCFGGIITDNRLPILTYDSWYKVNWEKMPPVGSKVEVILQLASY